MKKTIFLFVSILFISPLLADSSLPPWKHFRTRKGVELFKRSFPGTKIIEVKGTITVDAGAEIIDMLFRDIPAFTQYMHNCIVSRTIHMFSDEEMILYNVTKLPWPLHPRDVVTHITVTKDFVAGRFQVHLRGLKRGDAEKWVPLKKKRVRIYKMIGTFDVQLLERNRCRITYTVHADPTGLPPFVVNIFSDDNPYETLRGIRRMVKKKKYIDLGKKSKYLPFIEKFFKEKSLEGK